MAMISCREVARKKSPRLRRKKRHLEEKSQSKGRSQEAQQWTVMVPKPRQRHPVLHRRGRDAVHAELDAAGTAAAPAPAPAQAPAKAPAQAPAEPEVVVPEAPAGDNRTVLRLLRVHARRPRLRHRSD